MVLSRVADWKTFLKDGLDEDALDAIRSHGRTGHPLGSNRYLANLKRKLGRSVKPNPPGRPRKRLAN